MGIKTKQHSKPVLLPVIPQADPRNREDWETLLSYLPRDYEELARAYGQLGDNNGSAKIRTAEELLRFIFLHAGAGLPLRQTVALVAESGGPDLSAVRLHLRLRRSAPFLHAMVTRMVATVAATVPEFWGGLDPIAVDATAVSSPGATGTDARLHTAQRLTSLEVLQVEVTSSSGGESLKRFKWLRGQLAIGDRGYANPPGVAAVVDVGADVLLRVNRGTLPLHEGDEKVDVLERLRSLRGYRVAEWRVDVIVRDGSERRIPGRLIAIRLPDKEAEEARVRVRREYGSGVTEELIEAAGYVALYTTLSRSSFPAGRCLEMYRIRWQIELQFKRWKSICGLDRLPNTRDDTILSWLYAKVLLGLVMDRMGSGAAAAPKEPAAQAEPPNAPGDTSEETHKEAWAQAPGASARPLACQAWKITSILWPAIVSAILPLGLSPLLGKLSAIAGRFCADRPECSPRVVSEFRHKLLADGACCMT